MPAREAVLQDALLLSPSDRALLVDALEVSLGHGEFATPDIAAAWSEEIDRRLAAYDRGESKAVDFDKSLEHLRQAIDEHRTRRNSP